MSKSSNRWTHDQPVQQDAYQETDFVLAYPQATGLDGIKDLFLLIERWLQEGQYNTAVEYLLQNGYDYPAAKSQVAAVRSSMQETRQKQPRRHRN